jgi:hypothetical protein
MENEEAGLSARIMQLVGSELQPSHEATADKCSRLQGRIACKQASYKIHRMI